MINNIEANTPRVIARGKIPKRAVITHFHAVKDALNRT